MFASPGKLRASSGVPTTGLYQAKRELHGPKRAAMVRRDTVARNCGLMLGRAVALVALEAVIGVRAGQLGHHSVTGHLGDDRGGGDRQALGVALHDGARGEIE